MPPPAIRPELSLGCCWRHGCECLGDLASWGSQRSLLMENCLLSVKGAPLGGSEHPITGHVWGCGGGLDSTPGSPKETGFELSYNRTCGWSGELNSPGAQGSGELETGTWTSCLRIHPHALLSYSFCLPADMVQAFVGWAGGKGLWAGPTELEVRWGGAGPRPAHKGLRR